MELAVLLYVAGGLMMGLGAIGAAIGVGRARREIPRRRCAPTRVAADAAYTALHRAGSGRCRTDDLGRYRAVRDLRGGTDRNRRLIARRPSHLTESHEREHYIDTLRAVADVHRLRLVLFQVHLAADDCGDARTPEDDCRRPCRFGARREGSGSCERRRGGTSASGEGRGAPDHRTGARHGPWR